MPARHSTRNVILKMVQENPQVSMAELCKAVHMQSPSNIQYHLSRLTDEGLIDWKGSTGTKKKAREQREGGRWRRGDVTMRRMSKKEQMERIEAVVAKAQQAVSDQQLAFREERIVRGEGWSFRPVKASRVG